jgi:hypothetical protein
MIIHDRISCRTVDNGGGMENDSEGTHTPRQFLSCSGMQLLCISRSKGLLDRQMNDGVTMPQKTSSAMSSVCRTFEFQQRAVPEGCNDLFKM